MSAIKTVTVAGVTGAIGPSIVTALYAAGFKVQALTRNRSAVHPSLRGIKLVQVDYKNATTLAVALRGQDAVISALGDTADAVAAQGALIEASIHAGVTRFIPSEFGSDTTNPRVRSFPFFKPKLQHQELLEAAAVATPSFSYSILITGPFIDWGMSVVPFIINVGSQNAQVFDGGDVPFSVTRTAAVGKAVASMLTNLEATKNRALCVHEAVVTQNQLIARTGAIRRDLGKQSNFIATPVNTALLEQQAWEAYDDPTADELTWIFPFINISFWSAERLCAFDQTDNSLLGIEELHGNDLVEMIDEEILRAINIFEAENSTKSEIPLDCKAAADKAMEEGRRRLVGAHSSG